MPPESSAAAGANVRAAAAELNLRVLRDGQSLDAALAAVPSLPERDRGFLAALAYGSLRWHHRLQWQVDQLLTRKLARRDAVLGSLLRTALFELQQLRVPDHAAVSSAVEASRRLGLGRAKGLINAVLRRFLRERAALDARLSSEPVAQYSHPAWMIDRLRQDWPNRWRELLEANNQPAAMWLRVNVLRTSRDAYLRELQAAGIAAHAPHEPVSAISLDSPRATAHLPGFEAGVVSVQDAAAQLAAEYLDLKPGLRVLDACAAPGGKTAHMLEICPDLRELCAIDADAARLSVVRENLARLGLKARLVCADARQADAWWDGRPFERILLDAPCTALGIIRRHPDIKVLRQAADIEPAVQRQAELLRSLWPTLAVGGRLVYATCTVLRAENHSQIQDFLVANRDARLASERQLFPGEANMDGFYYACLDKHHT